MMWCDMMWCGVVCLHRWGCGAFLPPAIIGAHEATGCPKRSIVCAFGCGIDGIIAEQLLCVGIRLSLPLPPPPNEAWSPPPLDSLRLLRPCI
jgi:hypothetical protein